MICLIPFHSCLPLVAFFNKIMNFAGYKFRATPVNGYVILFMLFTPVSAFLIIFFPLVPIDYDLLLQNFEQFLVNMEKTAFPFTIEPR